MPTQVVELGIKTLVGASSAGCTTYRTPLDIKSGQGIHFVGHKVQEWADENDAHQHLPLPPNPTAAGL